MPGTTPCLQFTYLINAALDLPVHNEDASAEQDSTDASKPERWVCAYRRHASSRRVRLHCKVRTHCGCCFYLTPAATNSPRTQMRLIPCTEVRSLSLSAR